MDKNKMLQFTVPFLGSLLGEEKGGVGEVINGFYKTGNKDITRLLEGAEIFNNMIKTIDNFDYYNKEFTKILNTVVPHRWEERYVSIAMTYMFNLIDELLVDKKIEKYIEQLRKFSEENEDIFAYLLTTSVSGLYDIKNQFDENNILNEDSLKDISEEELKKDSELIPIKEWGNVKLYHGTSYDNYLEIKKDGYIKASDYSDATFPNDKVEIIYSVESGFVFAQDSMDMPLSFVFGGYRKNAIPWAYKNERRKEEYKNSKYNVGVIFEINPEKYEVYFHPGKQEFMIKGNVSISDTNVLFYDWNLRGGVSPLLRKIK